MVGRPELAVRLPGDVTSAAAAMNGNSGVIGCPPGLGHGLSASAPGLADPIEQPPCPPQLVHASAELVEPSAVESNLGSLQGSQAIAATEAATAMQASLDL
jgi:hypothetical protein